MLKIHPANPRETYMYRTYGVEPYQVEVRGRTVCGVHDYQAPGRDGMEKCSCCGAKRYPGT